MTEKEKDWTIMSERLFHVRDSPGKLAMAAVIVSGLGIISSILVLYLTGRFQFNEFTIDMILSTTAIPLCWGVFGWSGLFLKKAYFDTITNLAFKNEEEKSQFYTKEAIYSRFHAFVGAIIVTIIIASLLSVFPLFLKFFPLTLELAPFLFFQIITWAMVGVIAVDGVSFIPTLIGIPKRLKEQIVINPLKPDRCGGAKAVGDFFFIFTVMIAVIGSLAIVVSGYLLLDLIGYVLAGFLMALALVVFLVPQFGIRDILREEKSKRLEEMSNRIEILSSPTKEIDRDVLMISFIQVQSLIMLYGEVEKLREFPFETSTLRKVVTTSLLPFILSIILDIFQLG